MNSPVAWALVFHILGIVVWMAGLLMVTQILAAHTRETAAEAREALARVERKLLKGVSIPGAAITLLAGGAVLVFQRDYIRQGWLHAKLFLVAILIGLHLVVHMRATAFQGGRIELKRGECTALHGAIALVLIGIVILVMIKPF